MLKYTRISRTHGVVGRPKLKGFHSISEQCRTGSRYRTPVDLRVLLAKHGYLGEQQQAKFLSESMGKEDKTIVKYIRNKPVSYEMWCNVLKALGVYPVAKNSTREQLTADIL